MNLEEGLHEGITTCHIGMIVVCEAITPQYRTRSWKMIKAAEYPPMYSILKMVLNELNRIGVLLEF